MKYAFGRSRVTLCFSSVSAMIFVLALAVSSVTGILGCTTGSKVRETSTVEPSSDLTLLEAQSRKERLSDVRYELKLDLQEALSLENDASFQGELQLQFVLSEASKDLRVDFFEGELKRLVVNETTLDSEALLRAKKKYWIDLPSAALKTGRNTVRFSYSQKYSRTGEGLHRFRDPVDGKVYLYTQFQTYYANRFLPSFDQPDLRAPLTLTVIAPGDWVVVTGGKATSGKIMSTASKLKLREWTFEPTPSISTYLFSLHAGPYAEFKDSYVRSDGSRLSLGLYVRESLKKNLERGQFFTATKKSLKFFEDYFAVKYPFSKLDQVVAPEFNAGGMENVAAITYSEWFVSRSKMSREQRRNLSNVVFHEVAHMWFGDLVTMSWWNGLWLNESFATYMAYLGQHETGEFNESWQAFGAGTKSRAYTEDMMVTTHPIEADIRTVKEAESIYDGITYNKGASVLKQLSYYMTPEKFKAGVRDYFRAYAYKNTSLDDFIGALQKHTDRDLKIWSDRWLRQSGADTVSTTWTCEKDQLRKISVTIETAKGAKPRPQSFEIGLYNRKPGAVKTVLSSSVRADFKGTGASGKETLVLAGDWACPQFVYPNQGDHGYVLSKIDSTSLQFLNAGLSTIDDLMTRSLVWSDLWRMVRDVELPLKAYVDLLGKNFSKETDPVILQQIIGTLTRYQGSLISYWPVGPASKKERDVFVLKMEREFLSRLKAAASGSDDEKIWYQAYTRLAETPEAMNQLVQWFKSGRISKNFPLDLDRAWGVASLLERYQHPESATVLKTMKKKDSSDRGLKRALSAEVVAPKIDLKKKWVSELTSIEATGRSLEEAEAVLSALFPNEQLGLKLSFTDDFFKYFEKNRASEDTLRTSEVLMSLAPLDCRPESSSRLKNKVLSFGDVNPSLKKDFLMRIEEDERCYRVREFSDL